MESNHFNLTHILPEYEIINFCKVSLTRFMHLSSATIVCHQRILLLTNEIIYSFQHGGSSLIDKYDGSPSKLITSIYSELEWNCWQFKMIPRGLWDDTRNQQEFMNWLATKVGVEKQEDWYTVT